MARAGRGFSDAVIAIAALAASGCEWRNVAADMAAPDDRPDAQPVPRPLPPTAVAEGCAGGLGVTLDPDLPAQGGPPPSPERLEAFREAAGQAFRAAADQLCARGGLDAGRMRAFHTLVVQNGSGATETAIYVDAAQFGDDALVFQWVFAESGFALPDKADIQAGLRCWADPDAAGCDEREP